ncbi:ZBBX isoform 5, partial [Pongo abelii]
KKAPAAFHPLILDQEVQLLNHYLELLLKFQKLNMLILLTRMSFP